MPKATSTGTTIVGCLFKDGIVLGADTRATAGPIVADKNCEKVQNSIPWSASCMVSVPPRSITDEIVQCLDSLYQRIHQMLWRWHSGGYRVRHCAYFKQH